MSRAVEVLKTIGTIIFLAWLTISAIGGLFL